MTDPIARLLAELAKKDAVILRQRARIRQLK